MDVWTEQVEQPIVAAESPISGNERQSLSWRS